MKRRSILLPLVAAIAAIAAFATSSSAQTLEKFPFRLNWTLYGEHAPFFVALGQGILQGRGARR